MKLLPINEAGLIEDLNDTDYESLPEMVQQLNNQMVDFYASEGFHAPWIGYASLIDGQIVGGGAFKSAPVNGQVEIAYYTLPELENQGYATATAQALIDLAIQTDEELTIVAQTLPETNASNHLLQKLGFNHQPCFGNIKYWTCFQLPPN